MTSDLKDSSRDELVTLVETYKHIKLVGSFLGSFIVFLEHRISSHDQSKLSDLELKGFSKTIHELEELTYGTDEYKTLLQEKLKPILDNHYSENSHHPEHYDEGVRGMNLLDIVEMFFDWWAASYRHADGDIRDSVTRNTERFSLSSDLERIFLNTVTYFEKECDIVQEEQK